ncbi:MAG: hypothetical protein ACFFD2_17120 [Promethearchaeota archaeon]
MNIKNLDKIRQQFIEKFGDKFQIVGEVVKPDRYGWDYWLVRVKPKESGLYIFNHFYNDRSASLYPYKSHEFHISIVEKGTRRVNRYNNSGEQKQTCPDIWVSDSIIIPILVMDITSKHQFTKTTKWAEGMDWLEAFHHDKKRLMHQEDLKKKNVINLKVLNEAFPEIDEIIINKYEGIPRRGFDISYELVCEAKEPSSFNLKLSGKGFSKIILPVRIVAEDKPIEALAGYAFFNEFTEETNSAHNLWFHLNIATLRPGDNLIVRFFNERRNSRRAFENIEKEIILN